MNERLVSKETAVPYQWGSEKLKLDIKKVDKGRISNVNEVDVSSVSPSSEQNNVFFSLYVSSRQLQSYPNHNLKVIPTPPNLKITPTQMGYPFIKIMIDLLTACISEHKWI